MNYRLPEADRERMTRNQLNGMIRMIYLISNAAHMEEDMGERLDCIPHGRRRVRMALGQLRSVLDDLKGTVTADQMKRLYNTCRDNEMRIVPKGTPDGKIIAFDREPAQYLIDAAQESKCIGCTLDAKQCRNCEMYKIMVAYIPLDDYKGENCPYGMRVHDWRDN